MGRNSSSAKRKLRNNRVIEPFKGWNVEIEPIVSLEQLNRIKKHLFDEHFLR